MRLTDLKVKNLKPRTKAYRVREKGSDRGFGVQVSPGGRKSFFMAYTLDGRERFIKLGVYPECTLTEARERCRKSRRLVDQGIDPQDEKKRLEEQERERKRLETRQGTVAQLFQNYIEYLQKEKTESSANQVRQAYVNDVLPIIDANTKAKSVTSQQIRQVLHRIVKRGSLIAANRTRSYLMAAFSRAIKHDLDVINMDSDVVFGIPFNPVRDIPRIVEREPVGDRDLSTKELVAFWNLLGEYKGMDESTKLVFKLMLATGGQRVKEVSQAQWGEFDADRRVWELPATRTKNHRHHIVPLNTLAIELLGDIRPISGHSKYLFPSKGDEKKPMPLPSFSRAISRYCKRTGFKHFTPRDLRRTCKTRMGELGLSKEIRDRLHNHALNDVSSKHYDRWDYMPEKTRAINAWGDYLQRILGGAEVVPIRKGGAN